jgi:Protein of unknown function (DUF2911)
MKKLLFTSLITIICFGAFAQDDKSKMPSPPASVTGKVGDANLTIKYHQPAVKGRKVWDSTGELAPYGKVWRTGANNATTFEIDNDIKVEGKTLVKGKYGLFTIPGEKEWVIIFNNKPAQWGAYSYKAADDVLRVTVPAGKSASFNERFLIALDKNMVNLSWENVKVGFNVN